jgi:hypothetical protein
MGFAIPKIEYNVIETQGNLTSGNGTITGIPDTSLITAGMFVRGAGVPSGAVVLSVAVNSIVLASGVLCTNTALAVPLEFGSLLEFVYPPVEQSGESRKSASHISESLSGMRQVSTDYIEGTRTLRFSFLSQSLFESMETFLGSWGLLGKSFRYYDDKLSVSYQETELDKLQSMPKKIAPKGVDQYVWEQSLTFRRVIV